MEEADVVVAERQNIAGEMTVDLLGASVILEVFVVGENVNDELGAKQEVAPVLKGADDGEKFTILDRVVAFGFSEGRGVIPDRVAETI